MARIEVVPVARIDAIIVITNEMSEVLVHGCDPDGGKWTESVSVDHPKNRKLYCMIDPSTSRIPIKIGFHSYEAIEEYIKNHHLDEQVLVYCFDNHITNGMFGKMTEYYYPNYQFHHPRQ